MSIGALLSVVLKGKKSRMPLTSPRGAQPSPSPGGASSFTDDGESPAIDWTDLRSYRVRRLIWDTFENPSYSATARVLSIVMILTIFVSVFSFAIGSMPSDLCAWVDGPAFDGSSVGSNVARECAGTRARLRG